jgi:hypothetical protein
MTADERADYLAQVNAVLPTVTDIVDLMEQMDQKVADLQPLLETYLPLIRKDIRRAKTAPGYLPSIGEQFDWIGDSTERDPACGLQLRCFTTLCAFALLMPTVEEIAANL